jgi:hypothetical protein
VILVDVPRYRVVANLNNPVNCNNYSGLKNEPHGSLRIPFAGKPRTDVDGRRGGDEVASVLVGRLFRPCAE